MPVIHSGMVNNYSECDLTFFTFTRNASPHKKNSDVFFSADLPQYRNDCSGYPDTDDVMKRVIKSENKRDDIN